MKKMVSLLLIAAMCFSIVSCNSGNNHSKDILGEWISIDKEDSYVKLFEDGTGELKEDGMTFDFEWKYDAENKNYRTNIANRRFTFETKTEEGITYLSGLGGYRFRVEDREVALAAAPILRENYINRKLDGKILLPLKKEISVGTSTIIFEQIKLSEDKKEIFCSISVISDQDMTSSELNTLLTMVKYTYFEPECIFQALTSGGNGQQLKIAENDLVAGEPLKVEISIMRPRGIQTTLEKWGRFDGYVIIKCGEIEYYINLGEYIKQ